MNALTRMERRDAKLAGLTHYFTGRHCQNVHIAERYTSNCIVCARGRDRTPESKAQAASYHALHVEARKEYQANYRVRHREQRKAYFRAKPSDGGYAACQVGGSAGHLGNVGLILDVRKQSP